MLNVKKIFSKVKPNPAITVIILLGVIVVLLGIGKFGNYAASIYADGYKILYSTDEAVKYISDGCAKYELEEDKVTCVFGVVSNLLKYEWDKGFQSPTATIMNTSNCMSASTTYCTIYNKLGIECQVVTFDDKGDYISHMFAVTRFWDDEQNETKYCVVDQKVIRCW